MSDTWTKYCDAVDKLRRLQDEARQRRNASIECERERTARKDSPIGDGLPGLASAQVKG